METQEPTKIEEVNNLEEAKKIISNYQNIIENLKTIIKYNKKMIENLQEQNKVLKKMNDNNKKIMDLQDKMIKSQEKTILEIHPEQQTDIDCPICKKNKLLKCTNHNGKIYYICPDIHCTVSNQNSYKTRVTYPDENGTPNLNIKRCPKCEDILKHFVSIKTNKLTFYCKNCKKYYKDVEGQPEEF